MRVLIAQKEKDIVSFVWVFVNRRAVFIFHQHSVSKYSHLFPRFAIKIEIWTRLNHSVPNCCSERVATVAQTRAINYK